MFHAIRAIQRAKGQASTRPGLIEEGGHPDYLWLMPPYGGWMEAKDGDDNFAFSALSPTQRDWLTDWQPVSWLWLFMGTGRCGTDDRAAFLIPWERYVQTEAGVLAAGLHGLAFREPHALEHRAAKLSVADLFADCALDWRVGHNAWDIPAYHCFWSQPPAQGFLFGYHCERTVHAHPCEETYAHDQLSLSFAN